MKRVAALVVAVVMVVAALVIRGRIDDDTNGGTSATGDARLVCATELAEACTRLAATAGGLVVTIEDAGATADRLVALPDTEVDDPGLDGWLVPEPWPGIVDVRRRQEQLRPVFAPDPTVVARSPLVIVARADRAGALGEHCGGPITWTCLGDVAGQPWVGVGGSSAPGQVRVTHTDPTRSATGLAVLAQATSDFFASTTGDRGFDTFLLRNADGFPGWLTRLETSATLSAAPFTRMLTTPAEYDVVGTTEAEAGPALEAAAADRRAAFVLLYPEPVVTADVVLALTVGDERAGGIDERAGGGHARDALAGAGWRAAGEPLSTGLDPDRRLPRASNLPADPGVFVALQQVWQEVTGR